jgi:hypothetical protein
VSHFYTTRRPHTRPRNRRSASASIRISGQSLAKTDRTPRESAHLAAGWICGSVTIAPPTVALAAKVFGVSTSLVREAVTEFEASTTAQPAIDMLLARMSNGELDLFVKRNLIKLWDAIDRTTA